MMWWFKIRLAIVDVLVGKTSYAANLRLIGTLAVDNDMCKTVHFKNVHVNKGHYQSIPDCGFYFGSGIKYKEGSEPRPL